MSEDHELWIEPIEPGTRPELEELEALIKAQRFGEIPTLYKLLVHSPPVAAGWERYLTAIRKQTTVPAGVREMVILRVAVLNGAVFEFDAHRPHALAAGVSETKIAALSARQLDRAAFDETESGALELADQMTLNVTVPRDLIARIAVQSGSQGLVELVATIAAYNMVSRFLVALNITH